MGENGACGRADSNGKAAQDLLIEFQQTGAQRPFEEIVRRYAGMVYNMALQVTRDAHDAEDAAQATFLTLAVHAKTEGNIRYVGPWLRKVAHRLALDLRRSKKRRLAREHSHGANGKRHIMPERSSLDLEELRHVLREELDKLPAKYRMPLILYYFGGLSAREVVKELRCNASTLGVRLHRGRKMLAEGLAGRGITTTLTAMSATLLGVVDSFVKDNLVYSTPRAASHLAAGGVIDGALISAPALELMRRAGSVLIWHRVRALAVIAILAAGTLGGAAHALHQFDLLNPAKLLRLDLTRLIGPLLQRLLAPPTVRADASQTPAESTGAAVVSVVAPPVPMTSSLTLVAPCPARMPPSTESDSAVPTRSAGFFGLTLGPIVPVTALPRDAATTFELPRPVAPHPQSLASVGVVRRVAPSPPVHALAIDQITIDRASGGEESMCWESPALATLRRLVVGHSSTGRFVHRAGELRITDQVVLGEEADSSGTFEITETARLITPELVVADKGRGAFEQSGGEVIVTDNAGGGQLTIADEPGSSGDYLISGGTLYADNLIVGRAGQATFAQSGGIVSVTMAQIGSDPGSQGTWSLTGGQIQLQRPTVADSVIDALECGPAVTPAAMVVGGDGSGTLVLRSDPASVAIQETPPASGAVLVVRAGEEGDGAFRGWGTVQVTGPFVQNGRVVADGFGQLRKLDFSSVRNITNTIENPADGGQNGWYARRGGMLILPSIKITGEQPYTWGEDRNDAEIDLVNSLRFHPHDVQQYGSVSIALLDPEALAVPPLPNALKPLGLWQLNATADFDAIDLVVRYDDAMAQRLEYPESSLRLWAFDGVEWEVIPGGFGVDAARNLIWATTDLPLFFAVSAVPEPSTIGMLAIAAGALAARRRVGNHG